MSERLSEKPNSLVGWLSTIEELVAADAMVVTASLNSFIGRIHDEGAGYLQRDAWDDYIPGLQKELSDTVRAESSAAKHLALLEYRFQFDGRRPDFLLLANGTVLVVEFKKKDRAYTADIDQVMAYARDLVGYHRVCSNRNVVPILVPTHYVGPRYNKGSVWVCGLNDLDPLVREIDGFGKGAAIDAADFMSEDSYCPLPTLVSAARELFEHHVIRQVSRAHANTEPAVGAVRDISVFAAQSKTRHLILINGVPGAGKTLVGLRAVHANYLSALRTTTEGAPAVFLSGNGPLVKVLQHVIKTSPGGDTGKATIFVKDVKGFREKYVKTGKAPPQHVIVSDEAQRAWDAAKMARGADVPYSEPHVFIDIASRVPDWSVFVGLIGSGQEIHEGEESGVEQWFDALVGHSSRDEWTVHIPPTFGKAATSRGLRVSVNPSLSLDREIRFHLVEKLHEWVNGVLGNHETTELQRISEGLKFGGIRMYLTRDLQLARDYVQQRYKEAPDARYGIIASSRDKELVRHGVPNDWASSQKLRNNIGPWFAAPSTSSLSCCQLTSAATEFDCQGLELDFSIVGWGTDFVWTDGRWSIGSMKRYQNPKVISDPLALRTNAYRVLLTRGRDGFVVFAPRIPALEATIQRLIDCGVVPLEPNSV